MIPNRFRKLAATLSLRHRRFPPAMLPARNRKDLLSVKRIYSQPSLGGRLNRGVQWSPDGKLVSFFETKGRQRREIGTMDDGSEYGKRQLLVSSEKLETVLPAEKTQPTQATGLGRRTASQYQWAPGGNLLFVGTKGAWLAGFENTGKLGPC